MMAGPPDDTTEIILHGLRVARGSESERAHFHAGYLSTPSDPDVEQVEVITERRRVVLLAEEHARRGDVSFQENPAEVREALRPARGHITVAVRLRFHPRNGYASLPSLDLRLGTGPAMHSALYVKAEPLHASPAPGDDGRPVIVGARVEATFAAAAVSKGIQTLVIHVNNVYLLLATIDLSRMP
jgi:hypothetical protein